MFGLNVGEKLNWEIAPFCCSFPRYNVINCFHASAIAWHDVKYRRAQSRRFHACFRARMSGVISVDNKIAIWLGKFPFFLHFRFISTANDIAINMEICNVSPLTPPWTTMNAARYRMKRFPLQNAGHCPMTFSLTIFASELKRRQRLGFSVLHHTTESWWLALPDCDFDGIVPEVLSKFIYKWSSYILMSMYSWRQANSIVSLLATTIDTCQSTTMHS